MKVDVTLGAPSWAFAKFCKHAQVTISTVASVDNLHCDVDEDTMPLFSMTGAKVGSSTEKDKLNCV